MMFKSLFAFALLFCLAVTAASARRMPFRGCKGYAKYSITFRNFMNAGRGGPDVPALAFSPLSGVSHSNRLSFFTVRGYADEGVAAIAKTGDNQIFLDNAKAIKNMTAFVRSIDSTDGPTLPWKSERVILSVDCMRPFVTVLAMLAPSPDWLVQINNMNLFNPRTRSFISRHSGNLITYDAGVDSGSGFTDPSDPSLDIPTQPQQNIAPLSEDETDPFGGRIVGRYIIKRITKY